MSETEPKTVTETPVAETPVAAVEPVPTPASTDEASVAPAEVMPTEELDLNATHARAGIELTKVATTSGEEDEEILFCDRCALYRFVQEENDWRERARGDVQILQHKETKHVRALLRQEKTFKVRLNQYIGDVELKPNSGSDKAWTWRWIDFATDSGEGETHTFAIRFRTAEISAEFNKQWEIGRAINKEKAAEAKKDE